MMSQTEKMSSHTPPSYHPKTLNNRTLPIIRSCFVATLYPNNVLAESITALSFTYFTNTIKDLTQQLGITIICLRTNRTITTESKASLQIEFCSGQTTTTSSSYQQHHVDR
eukprot:scaffold31517_cov48-Cyclotella_meneghiniana.AAC.1